MSPSKTPIAVEKLRAELDKHDIAWQEVRDYPAATYLLPEVGGDAGYTIWWQGPASLHFQWGHNFEFQDATPQDIIKRLETLGS